MTKKRKYKRDVVFEHEHKAEQFSVKVDPNTNKKMAVCINCRQKFEVEESQNA